MEVSFQNQNLCNFRITILLVVTVKEEIYVICVIIPLVMVVKEEICVIRIF